MHINKFRKCSNRFFCWWANVKSVYVYEYMLDRNNNSRINDVEMIYTIVFHHTLTHPVCFVFCLWINRNIEHICCHSIQFSGGCCNGGVELAVATTADIDQYIEWIVLMLHIHEIKDQLNIEFSQRLLKLVQWLRHSEEILKFNCHLKWQAKSKLSKLELLKRTNERINKQIDWKEQYETQTQCFGQIQPTAAAFCITECDKRNGREKFISIFFA